MNAGIVHFQLQQNLKTLLLSKPTSSKYINTQSFVYDMDIVLTRDITHQEHHSQRDELGGHHTEHELDVVH